MTKRRFIIASLLKKIGISLRQKRLVDAASELRLLRDAEEILGRSIWTKVKDIEQYKNNYLNISNLLEEKNTYQTKIQDIRSKLDDIRRNQESKFKDDNSSEINLEELYEMQKSVVDKIKSEQSDISIVAANIKKIFDQSVSSLQAIMNEGNNKAELSAEKAKIEQLKNKFADLKEKKIISDENLAKETAILSKISDSLKGKKNTDNDSIANNYEIMGKANKALSSYYSKIGFLDNHILLNYNQIGQNISNEWQTNSQCKEAVKSKLMLCKIIKALRRSIDFNTILADRN